MALAFQRVALAVALVLNFCFVNLPFGIAQSVTPSYCSQSNYASFQGRCYRYSTNAATWNNANNICINEGGTLVSMHTLEENQHVGLTLGCRYNRYGNSGRASGVCWIGLYQLQGESSGWQWINGDPVSYTKWAPNEPNNVDNSNDGGEDCAQIWDRQYDQGNWNDEPCEWSYPFVCVQMALCPAGYYQSRAYERWTDDSLLPECSMCPGGTYRAAIGALALSECLSCPAGKIGNAGRSSVCTEDCPQGYYCPAGTDADAAVNSDRGPQACPAGTYGPYTGLKTVDQCKECDPGYFCGGQANTVSNPSSGQCDAGRCGFMAQKNSQCTQICPPGYRCPAGSACPGATKWDSSTVTNYALDCGGESVFCPAGSITSTPVDPGFYSIGSPEERSTGQVECEPGYYCTSGRRILCPGGTYRSSAGAMSEAECSICQSGYTCPSSRVNTSPQSVNCYDDVFNTSLASYKPSELYCPAGSAYPLVVEDGMYTTPETDQALYNRKAQISCDIDEVCAEGLREALLQWSSVTTCATLNQASVAVPEMSASGTILGTFPAAVPTSVASEYDVSYLLGTVAYFDSSVTSCEPTTRAKNKDIFQVGGDSGSLSLTRDDLQFETCLPTLDVRYKVPIIARVFEKSTSNLISSIQCPIIVEVQDANDQPVFIGFNAGDGSTTEETIYYRQINEGVQKNVPVAVCDSSGYAAGCPITSSGSSAAELLTEDEDDGTVLQYSIVSGDDGAASDAERPFKIDPCSGLVSARISDNIRFNNKSLYRYVIAITDDGNGGRFTPKTAEAILYIYVIDVNDNPVFTYNVETHPFYIIENQPENSLITGTSLSELATDEDGDSLNFQIVTNDGDAFKIVNNQLLTTRVGAETINYESSKKRYFLDIEVQDNRGGFAQGTIQVLVQNANDPPSLASSANAFYVFENSLGVPICTDPEASCTLVNNPGTITATDEDGTSDIVFELIGSHTDKFTIDASTGVITTSAALNFEDESLGLLTGSGRGYTLSIKATSQGESGTDDDASTTASVTVYVVDENEQPTFSDPSLIIKVPETWPVGAFLPTTIQASDPDNEDTVLLGKTAPVQTLTFSNFGSNAFFTMSTDEDERGTIKVSGSLLGQGGTDIPLLVRIQDNGGPVRQESTNTFLVTILDVNEAPTFNSTQFTFNANENEDFLSSAIFATDNDIGQTLTYSVIGGNGQTFFEIVDADSGSGISNRGFKVKKKSGVLLNYELSSKEWTLNIQVADEGPSAKIGIFCNPSASASCGGGAFCDSGRCVQTCYDTVVANASVYQAEVSLSSFYRCDYSGAAPIESINGQPSSFFSETAETTVVITIVDKNDAPAFTNCSAMQFQVVSNRRSENQVVGSASNLFAFTYDEDAQNPGSTFDREWSYTVIPEDSYNYFTISNGALVYQGSASNTAATGQVFHPTLRVIDAVDSSFYSDCLLNIIVVEANTPPSMSDYTTPVFSEGTDISGENDIEVLSSMMFLVVDPDDNENFTFTTSSNPYFNVDPGNGRITVGSAVVSYESFSSHAYELIVRVRDSKGAEDVATVTIPIGDVNEAPSFASYIPVIGVPENSTLGTIVQSSLEDAALVSDPDIYSSSTWHDLSFSLASCSLSPCPFSIDEADGSISLISALDYEGVTSLYSLSIVARDGAGLEDTGTFTIQVDNVNENPVFISDPTVSVDEGGDGSGSILFNMKTVVEDPDVGDEPENLVYTILDNNSPFSIENGVLMGTNSFKLDYEAQQQYNVNIEARDSKNLTARAEVTVLVRNINDVKISSVTVIDGYLSCSGGSQVVITGNNFGLINNTISEASLLVKYTNTRTGAVYVCDNPTRTSDDNTQVTCTSSAGVGSGFLWTVSVTVPGTDIQGDTSPAFATPSLSFAAPTVTEVVNATAFPTRGGQEFHILGTCMGFAGDFTASGGFGSTPDTFVRYCSDAGICVTLSDCVMRDTGIISCTSLPGIGGNLRWTVKVAGATSTSFLGGSYARPSILSLSRTIFPSDGDAEVIIRGDNFAGVGETPDKAYGLLVFGSVEKRYQLVSCIVSTSYEEITCAGIEPGMGTGMSIVLVFGGLQSLPDPLINLGFVLPTITTFKGEGVDGGSTVGGQQVVIEGSGFGPACGRAATNDAESVKCDILSVQYSRNSQRVSDGSIIRYSPDCVVVTDSRAVCSTTPGTGAGHLWVFNFGGHQGVSPPAGVTTSYAVPTVGGYEGVGAQDALTSGNQEVLIRGSNFGPANGAAIVAFYGPEGNPSEFGSSDGISCEIETVNEVIRCYTVEGAGNELTWTVYVDDQKSRAETTSYGDPEIGSIDVTEFDVDGGDVVMISGLNFGPQGRQEYLEDVSFGPLANIAAYNPSCTIRSHTQLRCTIPPGIGTNMYWTVTVKGQTSTVGSIPTAYTPLELLSTASADNSTQGGYLMRVYADGLPICDSQALISVLFGSHTLSYVFLYDDLVSSQPISDVVSYCASSITRGRRSLSFYVPELATSERNPGVGISVSSKRFSAAYVTELDNFEYAAPVLDSVYAEPSGSGTDTIRVVLRGKNFCRSTDCCQTLVNGNVVPEDSHSHEIITLNASVDGATVQVRCGNRYSEQRYISTSNPFTYSATTSRGTAVSETIYPTEIPEGSEFIDLFGLNYGEVAPTVSVGGRGATVVLHEKVSCTGTNAPSLGTEGECYRTRIYVPSGQGSSNGIIVMANSGAQSTPDALFEFVHYAAPLIASIDVIGVSATIPTIGGRQLRISGSNFGISGQVYLYQYRAFSNGDFNFETNPAQVGKLACSPWNHSTIMCTVPPGEGVDLEVRVEVGDQNSRGAGADPEFTMSYEPPVVTGTSFQGSSLDAARTIGGDLITIHGQNFGRPYLQGAVCPDLFQENCTNISPRISLGGLSCTLVNNTHSEIVCMVPPGQGIGLTIGVGVRGQSTSAGDIFGYLPPKITSFTPLSAPTSGRRNGNAIMMEISGDNFGVDELEVRYIAEDGSLDMLVAQSNGGINNTLYPQFEYNHTFITFEVPAYRGKDLMVVVIVAGQKAVAVDYFSYLKPVVAGVSVMNPDDTSEFKDVSEGAIGAIAVDFLPDSYEPGTSLQFHRRRFLMTSESTSRLYIVGSRELAEVVLRTPATTSCDLSSKFRGYSWITQVNTVLDNGVFYQHVDVFPNEYCSGEVAVSIETRGGLSKASTLSHGEAGCTTPYMKLVESIEMTPQTLVGVGFLANMSCCGDGSFWAVGVAEECACEMLTQNRALLSTGKSYGVYLVNDLTDLYFSEPVSSPEILLNQSAFILPRYGPTYVSVDNRSLDETPTGPTSGCYEFESYEVYQERRAESILLYGTALNVYRRCVTKALMTLTGDNFSTDIENSTNSNDLQIFFVDEKTGASYRAATTTSQGDHNEICSSSDGCVHTHEQITFQIPPGAGLNLLIMIQVGNQDTFAEVPNSNATDSRVRFNYMTPSVSRASPGTLTGDSYEFADAAGDVSVDLRGTNFGGVLANTTIYVDGRICPNSRWRSPDEDLTTGLPFLSCEPEADIVGPRNLFVCVSNQATLVISSSQDTSILTEADYIRMTSSTSQLSNADQATIDNFHSVVTSRYNTRCKSVSERSGNILGQYGGLGQLCVTCPGGAVCETGDAPFVDPHAAEGYYRLDVAIYEEDGKTVRERAALRCPSERWDTIFLDTYPSATFDSTCSDYVACQPSEACLGANNCDQAYRYAYDKCNEVRSSEGYNNSCGVFQDPFTGVYKGIDMDCNPNPTSECTPDSPQNCAKCIVTYDREISITLPVGRCECTMPQRCALCTLNTHYRLNNRCQECPQNVWMIILAFSILVLLMIAAGYYFNRFNLNLALLAIGIDFAQVLSVFSAVNLEWPQAFEKFLSFFSFLSLNIDIVGIECIVPTFEYETKWWLSQSLPLVVLAILILMHLIYSVYKVCRHTKRVKLTSHVGRLVAIYLVVCYVLYIAVTRKSLEIFDCTALPEDDGYTYTSFTSLSCDGGSLCRCGEPGGIQKRLVPLAVMFLLIYTIGFPLFVYLSIRRHRSVVEEDQYLRAHGVGDTRESGPRTYDFRKSFSTLYVSFKPSRQTWVVLIILRKALIAICALLLRTNVTAVLAMVLLILFGSFVLTTLYRPYMSNGERSAVLKELDELATKGLDDPKFSKYTVLQRRVQESVKIHRAMEERQQAHQHGAAQFKFDDSDKTAERLARRNQRRRSAAAFFFDYNSVELALLGSAILICLGGILLESMYNDGNLYGQRNTLSAFLIVLIVLTIVYYVVAVLSEIFPTSLSSYTKFLQRRRPEDHQIEDLDEDLNLSTNPIFLPGFRSRGNDSATRQELEENQAELRRIAEQNESLRQELRRQKQEDQMNDDGTDTQMPTQDVPAKSRRKQFSFRTTRQ